MECIKKYFKSLFNKNELLAEKVVELNLEILELEQRIDNSEVFARTLLEYLKIDWKKTREVKTTFFGEVIATSYKFSKLKNK